MFWKKAPKKEGAKMNEIHQYQDRLTKASKKHAAANRKLSKLVSENGFTVLLATAANIKKD